MSVVVGVDLGGTKTAVGLIDSSGNVIVRREVLTPAQYGARAVVNTTAELVLTLIAGRNDVKSVGVGSAGVIDTENGTVVSATEALPGWAGTDLKRELERLLSRPVAVMNDVHAHAVGESWIGAGRGARNMVLVAAGTGIGGAYAIDGVVQTGAHGMAGHFGHMSSALAATMVCACGRVGHVEAIASGSAILAAFHRSGGDSTVANTREVFRRAESGDSIAREVIGIAARSLGQMIGGLQNALDPDVTVVAGGLSRSGSFWWGMLRTGIKEQALSVTSNGLVVDALLGENAAIVGAAKVAFDRLEANS